MNRKIGYIANYEEACLVIHAARFGAMKPTLERLNTDQRDQIETGAIYFFVENGNGMKRWTDGRIWSPSKIYGEFLIYQEVPRHMSKNSIKKRKEKERESTTGRFNFKESLRDELLDRTTMHKKTVSIKYGDVKYHIIAYYRPIFENASLMDQPYFCKLSEALKKNPELKDDDFLHREMKELGDKFYEKYDLDKEINQPVLQENQRDILEKLVSETLAMLAKSLQRRNSKLLAGDD